MIAEACDFISGARLLSAPGSTCLREDRQLRGFQPSDEQRLRIRWPLPLPSRTGDTVEPGIGYAAAVLHRAMAV